MFRVFRGHRPDVTPAQLIAILSGGVPIIANLLHVFGVFDLSHAQDQALQDTIGWGIGLAFLLTGGDAVVRSARNRADAQVQAAAVVAQAGAVRPTLIPSSEGSDEQLPSDEEEFAHGPGASNPEARISPDDPGRC
jgi:microsomal dipeptidase-like Zn-dependent dipeptidase